MKRIVFVFLIVLLTFGVIFVAKYRSRGQIVYAENGICGYYSEITHTLTFVAYGNNNVKLEGDFTKREKGNMLLPSLRFSDEVHRIVFDKSIEEVSAGFSGENFYGLKRVVFNGPTKIGKGQFENYPNLEKISRN